MNLKISFLKVDLRNDEGTTRQLALNRQNPVLEVEGQAMAESIEAQAYLECSALTGDGIKEVLEKTAKLSILRPPDLCSLCDVNLIRYKCLNCCVIC